MMSVMCTGCGFQDGIHADSCNIWKVLYEREQARGRRLREALELLCYSVAGTEGTKTNAEFPEWYRARLKEANAALENEEAASDKSK